MSLLTTSLCLTCPACGKGKLYAQGLVVVDRCACCGLALKEHDSADGPAFFVMLLIGAIVAPLAVVVEELFLPPLWVHIIVWTPLVVFGSYFLLKTLKALLIGLEYKNQLLTKDSE